MSILHKDYTFILYIITIESEIQVIVIYGWYTVSFQYRLRSIRKIRLFS